MQRSRLLPTGAGASDRVPPKVGRNAPLECMIQMVSGSKAKKGWTSAAAPSFAEDEQQMRIRELEEELELAKEKFEQEEKSCQVRL